ncbi:MAG: carboxylesterase/lipase family protein [Alicyclobacillus macrosporangiidus]|uniref:carboxylesterase/lipase family protein n=1 Tax=Alicyclobacillus macrosporangiidus TaxID=392015 RepID=UPI0026E9E435|nr:carboxylesterase/lipase family protein [Alicyclobacillus macrosporangiidus]MCL6600528.1 carboxylesterase/lipase family protein [Alicyclobacillus macrosporangiidus]
MSTVVETKYGLVRGFTARGVRQWRGVPFAKPPVGARRFQPPEPPDPWDGVRDATVFGPASLQPEDQAIANIIGRAKLPESEDCLYLNIWAPEDDGPHPVMVWIHGGAYVSGAGSLNWYDGTSFAQNGVVLVTINYRLGALGFLYLGDLFGPAFASSANLGIQDQVAALRWVNENIAAFGGDPSQVTIFGESAGAGSVATLLATPSARGLFQRAILQSGSGALGVHNPGTASAITERYLAVLGVQPGDADALMAVPGEKFVEAASALREPALPFGPVVDGRILPKHPMLALDDGVARDIPVILGVTRDEYNLFVARDDHWFRADEDALRQQLRRMDPRLPDSMIDFYLAHRQGDTAGAKLIPLVTYRVFVQPMLLTADKLVQQGTPVWMYRFDWASPVLDGRLGACHAMEIPFVFNTLHQTGVDRFTGDSPERQPITDQMHRAWATFAKTGNPNATDGSEGPAWPAYDLERRALLAFGIDTHVEDDPYGPERAAWSAAAPPSASIS